VHPGDFQKYAKDLFQIGLHFLNLRENEGDAKANNVSAGTEVQIISTGFE